MTPFSSNQTIRRIVLGSFLLLFSLVGFSQSELLERKINVPEYTGTARNLIDQLSKSEGIIFAYTSEIPLNYEVTFNKSVVLLRDFLELLLKDKPINFKISGNKVMLHLVKAKNAPTGKLSQTIRGSVIDSDSKLPLPGVTVLVVGSSPAIGTLSDENGYFRLEDIPAGRASLQFSFIGYETLSLPNVEVNTGKEVVLEISMTESAVKLSDVIIRNTKKGASVNEMSTLSLHSISIDETKRYTGGMDDPARVASCYAGVSSSSGGSSDIIVRGNSPKYLQWNLDGIEIGSPYHMNDQNASVGALTALNNSLLATSSFYTGAFSPEHGNVLSSIMDMKLRTGNNEKLEATVGVGIMGTDITLEGLLKKGYAGSFLINYRYSTIALLNTLGVVDIPGAVSYQDATFKVVLPSKKIGTFSLIGLAGLSGLSMENSFEVPGTSMKDAALSKDFNKSSSLLNLGLNHTFSINSNSFVKTSLSYSSSNMDDDLVEGEITGDSVMNKIQKFKSSITNSSYRASVIYSHKINAKNKIQLGAKYSLITNDYYQDQFNSRVGELVNVTDFNKGINTLNNFISWKHSFNEKLSFVAGIHNMNVLLNQKSSIEPRIAINWAINNSNSIHAGYGKHSTMESVHNYYTKLEQPDGTFVEPNKNLDLLKADHYILGYEKRFNDNMILKLEAYYQHLYDLPVENNDTSYYSTINEGIDYRYVALVNEGVGRNYGIEFTLERFFNNNYYFLINGTLFDSKYKSLEGVWRNTMFNSNYLANVLFGKEFKNLGRKRNKTLAVNSKLFFGGGHRYIPLLRDSEGNVTVDQKNDNYWDYSKAYDNSIDKNFQLNLSLSYKVNKAGVTHELFLDLMNLTNNRAKVSEYYDASQPGKVGYKKQFQFFPNVMYRVYF